MVIVKQIRDYFEETIPSYMKYDFDNVGMLVGTCDSEVNTVLVALDITSAVIEEAAAIGAQLIVSHHPLIFDGMKRVTDDDLTGSKIIRMIRCGISAICLHTNLDTAAGGVNDCLMEALGGRVTGLLDTHGAHPDGTSFGVGRIGELSSPVPFQDFLIRTKQRLHCTGLRYVEGNRPAYKIACCGGAGGSNIWKAIAAGCDTYVTADIKYDQFLSAKELGLNLIDADHYCTENVVIPKLKQMLCCEFRELDIRISKAHAQTIQFI